MLNWPQDRPSPFEDVPQLREFRGAWQFSAQRISDLSNALQQQLPAQVACVAVSGSLARMEAHEQSDVDLLVVVDDRATRVSLAEMADIYQTVWQRLAESLPDVELTPPKPGGVFSECASWRLLTAPAARGIVNEDMTTYGQRMQLLLDAQPILHNHSFAELQADLLLWYSEHRIASQFAEAGPFHWLKLEVQRYWYSIQARACWLFANQPHKSLEVNVKLRSSRKLLITAFLHSIDQAHHAESPEQATDSMLQLLRWTPLEILTSAMSDDARQSMLLNFETAWKFCQSVTSSELPPEVSSALIRLSEGLSEMAAD